MVLENRACETAKDVIKKATKKGSDILDEVKGIR